LESTFPVEALFNQLEEGVTFAAAGGKALSDTQVICMGYNIISATGLFELPCRDWRQKTAANGAKTDVHVASTITSTSSTSTGPCTSTVATGY
jgi:hypothetical protein